jgi:hypothetical protein
LLNLPLVHCAVKSLRVARMVLLAMHLFFPLAIVQVLLSISAFPSARARIQPTPPSAARAGNRGPEPAALPPISEVALNSQHSGGELAPLVEPVWSNLIRVAGVGN